jgi:hypothetical protein
MLFACEHCKAIFESSHACGRHEFVCQKSTLEKMAFVLHELFCPCRWVEDYAACDTGAKHIDAKWLDAATKIASSLAHTPTHTCTEDDVFAVLQVLSGLSSVDEARCMDEYRALFNCNTPLSEPDTAKKKRRKHGNK